MALVVWHCWLGDIRPRTSCSNYSRLSFWGLGPSEVPN